METKLSITMETRVANVRGTLDCWFHDDQTRKAVTMALAQAGFTVTGEVAASEPSPVLKPWRVGRKVGRTIYQQTGTDPADGDTLIGVMDSRELASAAVEAHNRLIADTDHHEP